MNELTIRMTDPENSPDDSAISDWLGDKAHKHWKELAQRIELNYPEVFKPEWLFGGKKHGWSLRYKKSKSFCTFIPEKGRFALLIVFGKNEREKVELVRANLSRDTQKKYDAAETYHDGKWLLLTVDSERTLNDVMQLLAVKRKSKKASA